MNLDKRNAIFNNQEMSLMNMDNLKLIALRNMVNNTPLTYQIDSHDIPLNEYTTHQHTHVTTAPIIKERIVQRVVHSDTSLRRRLEQLKLQNNTLRNNMHANQNDLHAFGTQFGQVTLDHQNHILNLRNKSAFNTRDLDIVNEELGYFQFKNRQNFLQHSIHDRVLAHDMSNDMIDYQLHYLDNYNGAQTFNSNALISQIEQSGLQNTKIIPERSYRRIHQSQVVQKSIVEESKRERLFTKRKEMIHNRYTDEIPIRIDKISKSRDNKTSVISRQYKHSDHVKVILAENDEIVEVPDTQRVDNSNISQLIHESMSRKGSMLLQ